MSKNAQKKETPEHCEPRRKISRQIAAGHQKSQSVQRDVD
jgi:hypothetical protein